MRALRPSSLKPRDCVQSFMLSQGLDAFPRMVECRPVHAQGGSGIHCGGDLAQTDSKPQLLRVHLQLHPSNQGPQSLNAAKYPLELVTERHH